MVIYVRVTQLNAGEAWLYAVERCLMIHSIKSNYLSSIIVLCFDDVKPSYCEKKVAVREFVLTHRLPTLVDFCYWLGMPPAIYYLGKNSGYSIKGYYY